MHLLRIIRALNNHPPPFKLHNILSISLLMMMMMTVYRRKKKKKPRHFTVALSFSFLFFFLSCYFMGKTGGSFPHAAAAAASYHTAPYGCFVCVCVFEEESIVESCRAKEEGKFLVV
jgi:crotonobetainyl-CoA:carnitine CoA-transferase CaiB-like acyl-CoA transferase